MALETKLVVNVTQGETLCVGEVADRLFARMKGLIGREGLLAGEGLLLRPAGSIHTAFMRFAIDAVFLDRDMRVLAIVEHLPPWRVAGRRRARSVLELAAGECARCGVRVGDRLSLRDRGGRAARGARGGPAASFRSDSIIWPAPRRQRPGRTRDEGPEAEQHMRVLVVSRDRHFRSVTTMLLANRGCSVTATASIERVAELASRGAADVLVVDSGQAFGTGEGTIATLDEVERPIGVVVVGEGTPTAAQHPAVLDKWGPFEELFAAIERAGMGHAGSGRRR